MRKSLLVAIPTVIAAALLVWGVRALGASSVAFAFLVVWLPMTWLGTVSRVVQPRLPHAYHQLRDFERDGRRYERLGVRLAKRLLRVGPLALFNPNLHLPAERTPERLAHLDQRMRDAEASHLILLIATSGVAIHAAARGWWVGALVTLGANVLMNGYPVMLQRYNRALLHRRFAPILEKELLSGVAHGGVQVNEPAREGGRADIRVPDTQVVIERESLDPP